MTSYVLVGARYNRGSKIKPDWVYLKEKADFPYQTPVDLKKDERQKGYRMPRRMHQAYARCGTQFYSDPAYEFLLLSPEGIFCLRSDAYRHFGAELRPIEFPEVDHKKLASNLVKMIALKKKELALYHEMVASIAHAKGVW